MTRLVPWLLAVGSGAALALAMPGPGLQPLALLFPGLLLEAVERAPGGFRPALVGLAAGVVHWAIAVNWVVPVMHRYGGLPLAGALICLAVMGLLLGLGWAAAVGLAAIAPPDLRLWALPCLWVAVDAGRQFWPLGFPWNPVAAPLAASPSLLGSLPVWGATGLGWAVVTVGAGLWGLTRRRTRRSGLAAAVTAVVLASAAGLASPPVGGARGRLRVAVLQPGTSLEEKWDPGSWTEVEGRVLGLTERAAARGAELVLWPESALPYRVDVDPAYRELLVGEARRLGLRLLVNSVAGSAEAGYTNSVFLVAPGGIADERYDKIRLVPFGEFVPWWARLAIADSLVREVGRFEPGATPVLLEGGARLGVAVCYEVIFAELIATQVRRGAELLTTVTNDGWYGYSWAPHQHLAQVVLRAAESRRWFARAALSGISAFVDPYGRVVQRLEVGDNGVLVHEVEAIGGVTPRSRLGDWWLGPMVFAGLALVAIGARRRL